MDVYKRSYILIIALLLSFTGWNANAEDIDKSKANKIKAGLLYNIAKMITWPENSFTNNDLINILFLGTDTNGIGLYFESQARSQSLTVNGRMLAVKRLSHTELDEVVRKQLHQCHILFILSSYKGSVLEMLHTIKNSPMLIVGETSSFPINGGMIGLSVGKKHVRISVNLDAIKNSELKISAQFLQHVTIVGSRPD